MKRKHFAAAAASLTMTAFLTFVPFSANAETKYDTALATRIVNKSISTDGATAIITNETINGTATLKKVLRIDDTANIPKAEFKFITKAGTAIPATYDSSTNELKTMQVLAGVNPQKITYMEVAADSSNKKFDDSQLFTIPQTVNSGTSSDVTLKYAAQAKASGDTTAHHGSVTATDDNVLINDDITYTADSDSINAYYAIKEIQLDFSDCGFTEPGIYRYIIEEDNTQMAGISYDANKKRTLDVYVNDYATWYYNQTEKTNLTDPAELPETDTPKLVIAGYVMYVGDNISAPQATSSGTGNNANLESGFTEDNDTNGSAVYGGANGYEPLTISDGSETDTAAVKSEGFINICTTHKLTFKKLVTGNQGSKDKYFKFTVKLNDTDATAVDDDEIFFISAEENESCYDKTVNAAQNPLTPGAPNNATIYPATEISSKAAERKNIDNNIIGYYGNHANEHTINTDQGGTPVTKIDYCYVTGKQLKTGYDFYLQNGQFITITGIRDAVGYTITEFNEEYTPAITNGATDKTYDTINGAEGNTDIALDIDSNHASISDSSLKADAYETFTNDKTGTIPTGVLLSVSAPAIVGMIAIAGMIFLILKNKRREAEEE